MKRTLFVNVIANVCICVMLVALMFFAFRQNSTTVYNPAVAPIYKGNTDKSRISLMFNVYENSDNVAKIMQILTEHKSTATFFVGGCWAERNSNLLNLILLYGNELGNHGYFHRQHDRLTVQQNREEIAATHKLVHKLAGVEMTLFAPPSGAFNKTTLEVATELGYTTVMWSRDTIDWRDKDWEIIKTRAVKNAANGDLVLMHPTDETVKALPHILSILLDNGFEVVTVSQNIYN